MDIMIVKGMTKVLFFITYFSLLAAWSGLPFVLDYRFSKRQRLVAFFIIALSTTCTIYYFISHSMFLKV
jgi:hypothetical protein